MARSTFNKQQSIGSEQRQQTVELNCFERLLSLFNLRDNRGEDSGDWTYIERPTNFSVKSRKASDLIVPEESEIRIFVGGQTTFFGITLTSYPYPENEYTMKCQHILKPDKDDPIAGKMKIRDNDELISLHGIFLPFKTHDKVLDMFKEIKVDGETLTKMVVRRKTRLNKLKWYELLTILAPGSRTAEVVTVLNHEKHKLRKKDINNLKSESVHFYKVPGTQRYLMIDDTGLDAKHISDDTSDDAKLMIKTMKMCVNNKKSQMHFYASLRDKARSRYISVDGNDGRIFLADEPHWFEHRSDGNRTQFVVEGMNLNLAYDHAIDDVATTRAEFMFEEFSQSQQLEEQLAV
ncbi:uncharacterized protein LOC132759759 [Ruditapes philippinarum]|uniref:uncharacterized protein LOC132759759 n=1 Tax=Ruditapes philippinarum TaxID=129788 RepID=UPI00295C1079|nr:uncharacterized protein LOC132759759 [Ruditapes philippinarum]